MSQDLIAGFDQEAAAAVVARLVSFKMETEVRALNFRMSQYFVKTVWKSFW